MKKCRHCGAPIEDTCDTICAYCGEPLGNVRVAKEQYSHQEYSQQHTARQYTQHTSQQRTQTPYEQHLPNTINPHDTKRTEAQGKASLALFLSIMAIPFCTVFVFAVIALITANSVIKDLSADDAAIKNAKNAKIIAIISLCLGGLFFIGQVMAIAAEIM